ncbi:Transmembrane protein [Phytophthora palmivora]|uniref:Transmembrane protein n=1 Tax=Phytophthora palmivora TaxID=4796 RepID=A0A2P4YBR6_9STRA|nr:Transmembrane protein [Phytophthora palmivora]
MLAYLLLGFCFNGEEYGGDFDFSLSFPMLMLIVTIVLSPIVPVTWFFLHEERNAFSMNFNHYMHTLWDVIKTRAVYQYIAYQFFSGIFASFTYLSKNPIMRNWANVSPIQEKVGGLLSTGVYATSIYFAGNYGRSWDWRRTAAVTMVCYVSLDAFVKLMTIWNIVRSPYFWLGIPILEQIPLGVIFIVSSFIIVELATEGHEGAMYGLLTTVYNLAIPFATAITRNVDSLFDLSNERIQNDTNDVRTDMTMTVLIMWTANLCSLLFLVMLPRQKEQTRAMKQLGGSSYFMGVVTVSYLLFALTWTLSTSLLSIFETTSCLVIAGGNGCDKPKSP